MNGPIETWLEVSLRSAALVPSTGGTLHTAETLDYLPGSQFLGACANAWKKKGRLPDLISGRGGVSWSDALPCLRGTVRQGWPIPASYFLRPTRESGLWRVVNGVAETTDATGGLKPARSGYLAELPPDDGAVSETAEWFHVPMTLALKSQHRRKPGVSLTNDDEATGALFTYRAIARGTTFRMRVGGKDNDALQWALTPLIEASAAGTLRVGRSRASEYGGCPDAMQLEEPPRTIWLEKVNPPGMWAAFYCVSDVALRDPDNGSPTLRPAPAHFGFEGDANAVFAPERSFIRVRRYSPWNYFHQSWMTERQVIARGSVVVFRLDSTSTNSGRSKSLDDHLKPVSRRLVAGIGEHRVEGLGWLAVNPRLVWEPPFELREVHPHALAERPTAMATVNTPPDDLAAWIAHQENGGRT